MQDTYVRQGLWRLCREGKKAETRGRQYTDELDETSLFTKVPIAEALEVIGRRLEEQEAADRRTTLSVESVKRLLHLFLTSTYFMWNGRFYEQMEGAAMGNSLSPVVANIYMEHFEELALESAEFKPATWLI